jgi:hypothetical protein
MGDLSAKEIGLEIFSQIVSQRKFGRIMLSLTLQNPSAIKPVSRPHMVFMAMIGRSFRSSSMAEHPAVNRRVVSSSLTCGARLDEGRWNYLRRPFLFAKPYL